MNGRLVRRAAAIGRDLATGFAVVERWRRDSRGAATVELAVILPVLVILWLGSFEAFLAVSTYRKLEDATAQLTNVAAQFPAINQAEATSTMAAASQIMSPYSTTNLQIVMSEIQTDSKGAGTVTWSVGYQGGTALTKGSSWTLPASLQVPSTQTMTVAYILVQTLYPYQTSVGSMYLGPTYNLTGQLYMSPRQVASIPCTDC